MAIKVLVVHVNGQRTAVDPVKTGDPSTSCLDAVAWQCLLLRGGEGKFEADGLMDSKRLRVKSFLLLYKCVRLEELKARTKIMQEAEAKVSDDELQKLFENLIQRL